MRVMHLILLFMLCPSFVHAATLWVSQTGTAANCAQATTADGSDPGFYVTRSTATTCGMAAGDTIMFKPGTYTGSNVRADLWLPSGVSATGRSKVLCQTHQGCIIATSVGAAIGIIETWDRSNFQIGDATHGFIFDGVNGGASVIGIKFHLGASTTGIFNGNLIEGNLVRNHTAHGINFTERVESSTYYNQVTIRSNSFLAQRTPLYSAEPVHSIYVAIRNSIVESNYAETPSNPNSYGIHSYHTCINNTFRYNYIVVNGSAGTGTARAAICADSDLGGMAASTFYRNVFKNVSGQSTRCITAFGSSDSMTYYNNVCDSFSEFVSNQAGATGNSFINNLCSGTCTITQTSPLTCGGTCSTTNPTVVAVTHFKSPSTGDYSLVSGSSQINAGIDVGLPFNGAALDRGAHETFTCTTASINTNILDLTCSMGLNTPVKVGSTAGWALGCTGTGCGAPVVNAVSVPTGSSTLLRFVITGITGTDCAIGQTWTISYSSTTGTASDFAEIGGTFNQHLHTFSNLAVTNACTGSSPGTPGAPYIYYKFDGNANDSSGGARNGTASGTSFAAAKYGQGVQTNAGENDYVEAPYLSGINPSTQDISVCYGIFIQPTDVLLTRNAGGTPLGTSQRFHVYTQAGAWRLAVQGNSGSASEFSVQSGWNRICVTFDSGTDTAKLHVNGVTGVSAASVLAYTSYTFAGNYRVGLPLNIGASVAGNHLYDEFLLYRSVADVAADYAAWEPATSPWTGNLATASFRFYAAKTTPATALIPLAAIDTNITIPAGGAFTIAVQTDGTVADPPQISERLYYSCAACPSAGTSFPVPNTATADGIEFWGAEVEAGILGGAHGANLSGALTHVNGGTNLTADSIPVFDLAQNNSTVMRWILRIVEGTPEGRQFCFKPREQSGIELNGYTPASGACATVGHAVANGGP